MTLELGDDAATLWAAEREDGVATLGTLEEVLVAVVDDDEWRAEAVAALRRQLAVPSMRGNLLLSRGAAPMFHASPATNRASIARHGLDPVRMTGRGVAGSEEPEWPGTFLCHDLEGARRFAELARGPADLWQVDVAGLWLEGAPAASDGADDIWAICCAPLGPERVALVEPAA